jgi:hypothetical protein
MAVAFILALALFAILAIAVTPAIAKPGVILDDPLLPQTQRIKDVAEIAFSRWNLQAVITSGRDGTHMQTSKHYSGEALDFRRWQSDGIGRTTDIVEELRRELGDDYDVVLEATHIHVEYDPR